MKYTLDTIPVLDAFQQSCQCPLCRLQIDCEDGYIDSLLSSAYMEPECRIRTNKTGFCQRHNVLLYEKRNRLGLALMTYTHLQSFLSDLDGLLNESEKAGSKKTTFSFPHIGKSSSEESAPAKISRQIASCDICDQLDATMRRYAFTAVRLSLDNEEFRKLLECHSVCLPHAALLLDLAEETLSRKEYTTFLSFFRQILLSDLHHLEENLYEFTQQFDYRNAGKTPSEAARNSVEHAVNRLSGACVGKEAAHAQE